MAQFTEEFNVETGNGAAYRRFIKKLRGRLGVRFSHDRPVLPPQENPPNRWFDAVLRTGSQAIRLRIRLDNLYLDGYRAENSSQWLEFGRSLSPHLIGESTFLGYDGGYGGLQTAAGRRMERINLGQRQLITAVNQLATSTRGQERARSLIVVIQMICESIRFERISNHLVTTFGDSLPPPNWMMALEHGWQDVSAALLRDDANLEGDFPLPQPNAMQIVTALQAAEQIGILVHSTVPLPPWLPRMVGAQGQYLQGRPLVEVFWVRINNVDKEDPGDLYGTIKVTDGVGSQYIYNRGRDDYESIRPGGNALLTGPARAISAYGSFTIDLDLKDNDTLSPDDEVSRRQISWNVDNTTNVYDKSLIGEVDGNYGSVTVNYVVLSDAAEAKVEVTLIDGDGENPADVYGSLTARNSIGESELFRKASNEHIDVRPGQLIPLSRSIVAVPLDSPLIVRADLYDHDGDASPDDEIAKGTAEFPAQLSPLSEKFINGRYGKIRVRVTWTHYKKFKEIYHW